MPLSKIQFGNTGRRNMIINGAMQVAQRGNQTGTTAGFACDRFNFIDSNTSGVFDLKQSSTSPDGFAKSVRAVVTTAQSSLSSNSVVYFRYKFEGQDVQRLQYGTSSAQKFTLSYYVRSSITGTFTLSLYHNDANRMNIQTFTINSADTWEKKTHTFVGDTVSGFDNDTSASLSVHWVMASGTDFTSGSITPNTWNTYAATSFAQGTTGNILSATSNEFLLTGVQLEVGDTATEFEHRSVAEELSLCQRYYIQTDLGAYQRFDSAAYADLTSRVYTTPQLPTTMRDTPTVTQSGLTVDGAAVTSLSGVLGTQHMSFLLHHGSTKTANESWQVYGTGAASVKYDSEL